MPDRARVRAQQRRGRITDLGELRHSYHAAGLRSDDLDADPLLLLAAWLETASEEGLGLPNAMQLATADADGRPSVRSVLLKHIDEGLVWFTNYDSRKAREIAANPRAAVTLHWTELDRQVCAGGGVDKVDDATSDAYFRSRPRSSQLGAWASPQSEPVADRANLDAKMSELAARYDGRDVPRPPHWGGYRLIPDEIEFWQGQDARLHDRFRYRRNTDGWTIARLAP